MKNRGGRPRGNESNLQRRRKQWDALSADKQRMTKRPGSNKK